MKTYTVTVDSDGSIRWYKAGTDHRHREDGPAVEWSNGTKEWYINGKRYREDGPAVEWADGAKFWFINGQLHREGGPATELCNGTKYWFVNGKRHREDGPAVEYANGTKYWYINDEQLTEQEFNNRANDCDGRVVEIDGRKYKLTLTD